MAADNQESSIGNTTTQRAFVPSVSQQDTMGDDPSFEEPALQAPLPLSRLISAGQNKKVRFNLYLPTQRFND